MAQRANSGLGHNRLQRNNAMFAITVDLKTKVLPENYASASWQNAYADIGQFLQQQGFDRQQGSVYFGDRTIDIVRCQLAVQRLAGEFTWFAPSVTDIRMLRIEENNDVMPAFEFVLRMQERGRSPTTK
jgi:virulence-associated protein VapD